MSNQITKNFFSFNDLLDLNKPLFGIDQWSPKIDIKAKDDQYIIKADVPGVDPNDIEVTLENGVLILKGKKEIETKSEREDFLQIERQWGSFYRAITLPDISETSKIKAKSKNGVLEIIIPKNAKQLKHKIEIEKG